jgi:hypothetical protein
MKILFLIAILLFPIFVFSQTKKDTLFLNNKENKVVAVIDSSTYFSNTPDDGSAETAGDFEYYTNIIKEKLPFPVELIICNKVFFNKTRLKLSRDQVYYIMIKKGKSKPYIIEGVDTDESLLEQIHNFYRNK